MTAVPLDFFSRITAVNWGGKKLIFFLYEFTELVTGTTQPPPAVDATLRGLPYSGVWSLLGSVNKGPGLLVGVTNPVSPAMLTRLYQWTPKPLWTKTASGTGPPSVVYYVDDGLTSPFPAITVDNYLNPIPATDQCGRKLLNVGGHGGTAFNCNQQALNAAARLGFIPSRLSATQNGQFSSFADAKYYADAYNAFLASIGSTGTLFAAQFTLKQPTKNASRMARAAFMLNVNLIAGALPKGASSFTFQIEVGSGSGLTTWDINAETYTNLLSFPLDNANIPHFTPWGPPKQVGVGGGSGRVISCTVHLDPFTLQMS